MATAGETEASPPTDASWESGGGGDDEMKQALPELESSPQNGGGGLSIAEPGGGAGPEETAAASAAPSVSHEQTQDSSEAGAAAVPKGPEEPERPVRRSFQIPRKSREKKALFQPLTPGSREFEDVLNILHSSYLEPTSVTNFNYKRACLIHNELLEKEFTEKRRELKFDGRLDKELSESYAFLMVDRYQVQSICEKGLQVGQSKITILGSPSMGIYLSKYADLLQANPLEAGAVGDVVIFKIMKGKIKSLESILNKSALDPTPKHECHVSKNANRVTSLLAYRAYELTQYYFYEYIFDELRRRPRHVCPYAVVSFTYKDDIQTPKFVPSSRSNSFNADRNTDKFNYTLWKGQLLNKGKLLCYISLRSTTRAFLPIKLPEKLDVETVMSIDHLKQKIPPALFYKETYLGPSEVLKNGMYCSLYEVVEKTRIGSNMESLLQKLEKEKLVLVKPLGDRGYLFLLSPCQMVSPYEHQTAKSRVLHALFLFQEPRGIVTSQKGSTNAAPQKRHESMTDVLKITQFLQFALIQCRKEFKNMNTINFHSVVEKYVNEFFKRGFGSGKREFIMFPYDSRLDDKKFLYSAPKNKSHIDNCLHAYIFRPEMYQLPICKLKELFEENRKLQQFSPLSDYEGQEEEMNGTKMKFGKRNNSRGETIIPRKHKSSHSLDYDKDRVKELINLIQCRKKNVGGDSDTEDMRSKTVLKRKLEDLPENMRKLAKTSNLSENCHLYEESLQPIGSLGHDADLRPQQQDTSNSGVADIHRLFNWLSETLANARHSDASLTDTVNKALGLNTDDAYEELRQKHEYELNSPADKKEYEQPTCAKIENVHFKGTQSPLLEIDTSLLKYPVAVSTSEVGTDHKLHLKEDPNLISMNNFEDCSLCPTVPIEHGFRRQSKSNDVEETEIHWKLIPITDTLKGTTEDDVLTGQVVTVEEQCVPAAEPPTMSETTERTVLGEYSLFSRKIEEILKQKNVSYVSRISTPIFSTQEKMKRLSEFIYSKTSKAGVQEFVDGLHEKLNTIIIKASAKGGNLPPVSPNDSGTKIALNPLGKPVIPISSSDFNNKQLLEPLCSDPLKDTNSSEQHSSSSLGLTEVEVNQPHHATELMVTSDHTVPGDIVREPVEKETTKSPSDVNISAQPALSNFISQLEPEVFNSLVKIMKDVQKNTVKFYIHEEEESVLCKEIKEYLIKLGNTECHPEQFLERRSKLDKLLIIIQNEDIAGFIHKVPGLVTLKKLPCVSFAGVDSLDDVKNHTYNELFVSGGFIVSDESILNPEVITIENLKNFLTFLEELSTPEGKWQWKVHCKFQKKLKELGRLNAKALSLLTLLNVYQKKHLVEILSYHNCDSQTRNAPELDCLIRLQAQNVQQRHIVFLTEKNIKMISSYTDNGIVVATTEDFMQNFKNLVGYHNSITEENLPLLGANENLESQSALLENDEKDEEDMSLDSGDEISQIEVCSNFHSEILAKETKGSRGTDQNKNIQIELQSSLDVQKSLLEDKTCQIDSEERASVALVCSEGENSSSTEQDAYSSFQVYHSQLHMSHQFSHFNVLTHQTFLGTPYALSSSQSQESENYFLSAYTQSLDRDKSPSPLSWGKSDSSRPFSKEK
ncbi:protein TASOR isoform X4 [Panthera pardus]|uniref:Transcription activation suppressor n=2 Tax=Panthera TaxID=9688 RepID=A0A8C8WRA1_PANLE|nr:protein TASOR isoform X4 [Panthera leo]XP_042835116.1 protein TASOR isoform X4 [Panthera tigris]XP_043443618.1 protein TASOR isoform X4 [Prionailurus bengalensis]XP_053753737.1 protein TASOR isoform X4 [Panthera pardus]XP_060487325.1 protein TASOR isoform X5 [Panthera onca]